MIFMELIDRRVILKDLEDDIEEAKTKEERVMAIRRYNIVEEVLEMYEAATPEQIAKYVTRKKNNSHDAVDEYGERIIN